MFVDRGHKNISFEELVFKKNVNVIYGIKSMGSFEYANPIHFNVPLKVRSALGCVFH